MTPDFSARVNNTVGSKEQQAAVASIREERPKVAVAVR
jgi:hypothetical protein